MKLTHTQPIHHPQSAVALCAFTTRSASRPQSSLRLRVCRKLVCMALLLLMGLLATPARAADQLAVFGDFNNDGLADRAVVTSPTTITVSLANWNGSYTVTAVLSAAKNQQITYLDAYDDDGDGNVDVIASCPGGGGWTYTHIWLGNGDGTFGSRTSSKWSWPPKGHIGFF